MAISDGVKRSHSGLTQEDGFHPPFHVSTADPGALGPYKGWAQPLPDATTPTQWKFYIRNGTNSGWVLLFDTDTITAHAAQHATGGGDPVTLAQSQITGLVADLAAKASQAYVDATIAGLSWKETVRVATTVPGTLASDVDNGSTVDGVTLATGNRVLIKDQADPAENGIYIVAASGAPARALDADSEADILGASVLVQVGTANADTQWVLATNAPITVGVTSLVWTQFSTGGPPAAHASSHEDGDSDPLDVTALAGFPGGTTDFLREDGTFQPPPGGGGGATWEQIFDESGVSFSNWTSWSGTWSSDGTVIKQTNAGFGDAFAYFTAQIAQGVPLIFEAEINMIGPPADGDRVGIVFGATGSGPGGAGASYLEWQSGGTRVTSAMAQVSNRAITDGFAWGNNDEWHKIRQEVTGDVVSVYVDTVLVHSANRMLDNQSGGSRFIGLYTNMTEGRFRNIKLWTLSGGMPA